LLCFLFFNWVGYWLFISCFESRAETLWEAQVENNQYDPAALILIKVSAAALPYSNTSLSFERTDGKIDIGSIHYRYIRKRLYNDSVEFLCLPDEQAIRLQTARNDYFSLVNDLQNTGHGKYPGHTEKVSSNVLKVCYLEDFRLGILRFAAAAGTIPAPRRTAEPLPGYTRIGRQPPRQVTLV
jgi:hypothetical protein